MRRTWNAIMRYAAKSRFSVFDIILVSVINYQLVTQTESLAVMWRTFIIFIVGLTFIIVLEHYYKDKGEKR